MLLCFVLEQIPTSFRYRRSNEHESRRGRGRTFQRDTSENDLSMAIQASLETANLDDRVTDVSSSAQTTSSLREVFDVDPLIPPFESGLTANSEPPSRYLQALSLSSRNGPLQEASFPPLPISNGNNQPRSYEDAMAKNKTAGQFRVRVMNKKVPALAPGRPSASNAPAPLTVSPQHTWPTLSGASGPASGSGQSKLSTESGPSLSGYSSSVNARSAFFNESSSSGSYSQSSTSENAWPALSNSIGSASISGPSKPATENVSALSAYSASLKGKAAIHESSGSSFYSSSKNRGSTRKISHSASAPNLAGDGSFDSSSADFPPVLAAQLRKLPAGSPVTSVEDVHTANKSLVERMRTALNFDEDKYNDFKVISGQYRNGLIDAVTYLVCVEQFGLSHLLLELARLLPDAQKQKELIETYNANIISDTATESERRGAFPLKNGNSSQKGKKSPNNGSNTSRENLADSVLSTVRKLQSSYKPSDEEVEVLTKDGYRAAKGKSKVVVNASQGGSGKTGGGYIKLEDKNNLLPSGGSNQILGDSDGTNKQHKKTSKFHRVRLGEDSPAAILDLRSSNSAPDPDPGVKEAASDEQNRTEVLPVRGVWRSGGGQKLLARTGK